MPRLLTAVSLAAVVFAGLGCGGGDNDEPAATPAPTTAGFVTERGDDWSYARPQAWTPAGSDEQEEGKESAVFQSGPGTQEIPSQIGIGVASDYRNDLGTAVRVARDINTTRFRNYEITDEGRIDIAGAQAFKIDATYDSFTDDPVKIRIVDLYVQTPDKRQMNFFVRGPQDDLEQLGLDQIVASFRVL